MIIYIFIHIINILRNEYINWMISNCDLPMNYNSNMYYSEIHKDHHFSAYLTEY